MAALLQYQLALYQIDSMRKDGRFVGVDGSIPEGQGIVISHLNECHELLEMVCFCYRVPFSFEPAKRAFEHLSR